MKLSFTDLIYCYKTKPSFITDYHYVLETLKLIIGLSRFQILFYNYPATQFEFLV